MSEKLTLSEKAIALGVGTAFLGIIGSAGLALTSGLKHTDKSLERLSAEAEEAAATDGFIGAEVNTNWPNLDMPPTLDKTVDITIPLGNGICEIQASAYMVKNRDGQLVDLMNYSYDIGDVGVVLQSSEDIATVNTPGSTICSAAGVNN